MKYKCCDCGITIKYTFDNGDKKKRCESCAVLKYERDVPFYLRGPILKEGVLAKDVV